MFCTKLINVLRPMFFTNRWHGSMLKSMFSHRCSTIVKYRHQPHSTFHDDVIVVPHNLGLFYASCDEGRINLPSCMQKQHLYLCEWRGWSASDRRSVMLNGNFYASRTPYHSSGFIETQRWEEDSQ